MEDSFKLAGLLIVLTLVLGYSFNVINSFTGYFSVKSLASDLEGVSLVMKSLRELGSLGSWRSARLVIPEGYSLFFNNVSDVLEVHGLETFNLSMNNDVLYSVNLSSGVHDLRLYYGRLAFSDLKNETVVFK